MAFVRQSKTGVTAEQLKAEDLYGLLIQARGEAAPLSDDAILRSLFAAEDFYERDLSMQWQATRVFSDAEGRVNPRDPSLRITDFDELKDISEPAYDYNTHLWENERWALIQLSRGPIRSIQQVTFTWPGAFKVWQVPADWVRPDRRYAVIQIAPTSGPAVLMSFTSYILGVLSGGRGLPQALIIDYTVGFTPDLLAARHQDLLQAVRWFAALNLFGVLSVVASPLGATSSSLSLDGLSRSRSLGGKYGAYSGAIQLYLDREAAVRKNWHDHEKGPVLGILGA